MLKSAIFRLRFASGLAILERIDLGGGIGGSRLEKRVSNGMLVEHPLSSSHLWGQRSTANDVIDEKTDDAAATDMGVCLFNRPDRLG